ncbi:MAG: glycine--tRNA ligase subunit beta, partial [Alphaproteobacteria bacterium]
MAELLLELLSEEIPARMQAKAAADLKRLFTDELNKNGLTFDKAEAYVTPRRLALVINGLPSVQPDITVERKGPKVGAPDKAIEGFLKSAGLDSLDQCEVREIKGTEFHFIVQKKKGGSVTGEIIDILPSVVWSFPWPKSMRWADRRTRYVRPLHEFVLLFDGKTIDLVLSMEGNIPLRAGNRTVGHRFLAPNEFEVKNFADYSARLEKAFVMLDAEKRKDVIRNGASR